MSSKLLVVVSSGMEAKLKGLIGMRFAMNAKKSNYLDDVKVILFGPSEQAVADGDPDFNETLKALMGEGIVPVACSFVAAAQNITDKISDLGIMLEPVGAPIANYIREGYQVMTF